MKKILFILLFLCAIVSYSEAGVDTFNDDVTISGATTANGSLAVVGDSTFTGTLGGQDATFATDVTITGNLSVAGVGGKILQISNVLSPSFVTHSTGMPLDDTIPQKTEGAEYMTLAFTPHSATSHLKIDVVAILDGAGNETMQVALFQDDTAGALAAACFANNPTDVDTISFTHYMVSGTTSETTFKVRAGMHAGGAVALNSVAAGAGQAFGGVAASSITITEIG